MVQLKKEADMLTIRYKQDLAPAYAAGCRSALFSLEWKRLGRLPMLYLFVFCCVTFHCLWISGSGSGMITERVRYTADAAAAAGTTLMGGEWDKALQSLPDSREKLELIRETVGKTDILEGYDAVHIASLLEENWFITGKPAVLLKAKYRKLQPSVDTLAELDASLSVFAAEQTPYVMTHGQDLMKMLTVESFILACLIACFLTGNDLLCQTEGVLRSTRTGRSQQVLRFCAGACHLFALTLLTWLPSLLAFCVRWHVGKILKSNVSSQFLSYLVGAEQVPFLTWIPFSVWGYFLSVMILGFIQVLFVYILIWSVSLPLRNSYVSALCFTALFAFNIALLKNAATEHLWTAHALLQWLPFSGWYYQSFWFTDMLGYALLPWQETWQTLCLCFLAGFLWMFSRRKYQKQDL